MMTEEERKPDGGLSAWIETMEAMGSGSEDAELLCLLLELRRRRDNDVQPASPALRLPDDWVAVPREATREMIESGWTYSVLEKSATAKGTWACMVAAAPAAPHTAPIEPICATGGAEWVSNERVEEIIYRAEMFGHGAGYLPDEVIPMANELLALRKAFTQPIVWIHQTTGAKLNNSVIEDVRKQSGAWIPLYRQPNLPL